MSAFKYDEWPLFAYGRARKPDPHRDDQWSAWISAGGQHDAIVCHGQSKEDVLALRRFILAPHKVAEAVAQKLGADDVMG